MRRIIGSAVIASVVLWRVFVLDASWVSLPMGFDLWMAILFLAPVAFLLSVVVFLILGLWKKISLAEQAFDFLCSVVGWTLAGLGIASVIIVAISAYYHSSQGPFSIIFLDGPLGAGVGTVVGFFLWLSKNGKNIGWEIASIRRR
jgi:hypothetical protein